MIKLKKTLQGTELHLPVQTPVRETRSLWKHQSLKNPKTLWPVIQIILVKLFLKYMYKTTQNNIRKPQTVKKLPENF